MASMGKFGLHVIKVQIGEGPFERHRSFRALLRGHEQPSTTDVKQSLDNLADVSEKLLYAASNIGSLFKPNEKQSNEAGPQSPSFLNEVEMRTDSMDNLLEAVKLLQDEVQRLPELIETSMRKFREELIHFYEEQLEKMLSSAIETCLAISKEKIDELTSFVIEDLPESYH
ncbi:hypothetical protein TcWFU_002943 [Taenia crassiceps]|uniref:Uncharacterized protein n=1 Tax=Taenia crassiceps TaxID=6207 RepID=A0ABR4PZV4_9CEST